MDINSINPMVAKNHAPFSRAGWLYEIKYDGYRIIASPSKLRTRDGTNATTWYPEILKELHALKREFVVDGEVCTLDSEGRPDFEAMRVRRGYRGRYVKPRFTYFVFDLLSLDDKDLRGIELIERKALLRKLLPRDNFTIRYVDYVLEKEVEPTRGEEMYAYVLKEHIEGIVAKKADSPYVGGRNSYWYKFRIPDYADGFKRTKRNG